MTWGPDCISGFFFQQTVLIKAKVKNPLSLVSASADEQILIWLSCSTCFTQVPPGSSHRLWLERTQTGDIFPFPQQTTFHFRVHHMSQWPKAHTPDCIRCSQTNSTNQLTKKVKKFKWNMSLLANLTLLNSTQFILSQLAQFTRILYSLFLFQNRYGPVIS